MRYLVDSDWTIDHLEGIPEAQQLLTRPAVEGIAISMVTYAEVYYGILRSSDPQAAEAKLVDFLDGIPLLPFSQPVAREFAGLRETLRLQGKEWRRRAFDLVI